MQKCLEEKFITKTAISLCKKFKNLKFNRDLLQEVFLFCVQKDKDFNPALFQNVSYETYIYSCIKKFLWKKNIKGKNNQQITNVDFFFLRQKSPVELSEYFTDEEFKLIELRHVYKFSLQEISDKTGFSVTKIFNLEKKYLLNAKNRCK